MKASSSSFSLAAALLMALVGAFAIALSSHASDQSGAASSAGYGNCPPPTTAGVRICEPVKFDFPTRIASPIQVIASGTGAGGPVRLMQVFVDGVKVKQANGSLFDAPIALSQGTHRLVIVELDTTGSYRKSAPITLNIEGDTSRGSSCAPPSSPGVHVCEPDACHGDAWVTVLAAGTGASGSVRRMELWNAGVKLANFPGNAINTNLFLGDYSTLTIVEVDSAGAVLKSSRILIETC